jgi:2,4-dienoyl-CoA reductase-like NADH-dependent reductase (Old Yellow Enzyme family)
MLFDPFSARSITLANRVVMSPMTRSRAVEANTANALMAEYYGQRASAGLIITEGTSPSPNGLGYPRIPLYVHLVDHSSMGAPPLPADFKIRLRSSFDGLFILSGGFNGATAEAALVEKRGDLVAFGRPMLANPDLVARMQLNAPLSEPDPATFYTPGPKGYTDYPTLSSREAGLPKA